MSAPLHEWQNEMLKAPIYGHVNPNISMPIGYKVGGLPKVGTIDMQQQDVYGRPSLKFSVYLDDGKYATVDLRNAKDRFDGVLRTQEQDQIEYCQQQILSRPRM